jgi:DNA-binding XRE family transcriptional regulator
VGEVGILICHLRTILPLLDMSQKDLSDKLDVSRNTITNVSRNKTVPNLKLAYEILNVINERAEFLGIEKSWNTEDVWER